MDLAVIRKAAYSLYLPFFKLPLMKIIEHPLLPKANGHYSTAIVSNNTLYISGQLPIGPDGTHHEKENFEKQFEVIFKNIKHILEVSGSSETQIVKLTAYISDVKLWPIFNALYAENMGTHKPVRTVVPVAALHYGYLLEVDLIAEVKT